ncbi:hypothetical protein K437DRAFT_55963 [Tilletiaria anomala UBC 951]|uniref:Enhancer of polycomb-like protein n=1 Tax=Tilletiaria anomala (strain ATCC 24038 / CBS 436.72 / UBC 951) TaxID=1037660 RepID=A0A066WBL6_TILAU|nr:uncharacterized protein K437DRAFT_55963 [Tilletiaria anomala UBC 951]KDN51327.1 hypothetical protein K437DRAFT_55963 [Tilletiaria anomala UBC 951]
MVVRSRYKKLTNREKFSPLVIVHRGPLEADNAIVNGSGLELDGQDAHDQDLGVDKNLGVDRTEISEHHLQAALSSNQLATDGAPGSTAKAAYHIPTPDAKDVLSNEAVAALYPRGAYQDSVTYVRFSNTVEDKIQGPSYCLDEDDQEWLNKRNAKAKEEEQTALRTFKPPPSSRSKGKERAKEDVLKALYRAKPEVQPITEDEFETVFTVFEAYTAERCPLLHLNMAQLPTIEDLLSCFEPDSFLAKHAQPVLPACSFEANDPNHPSTSTEWDESNPFRNLSALKRFAPIIYPWWEIRKKDREGKPITPLLNFDETNDNDPYVCFRRREVKTMRKTRKTDALHIEKLVRLRSELESATRLLELVAQRERTKWALLGQDRNCWIVGRDLLDLKRSWGIIGPQHGTEDDELVFGTKKKEEEAAAAADQRAKKKRKNEEQNAASALGIKLMRKPRPSDETCSATSVAQQTGAHAIAQPQGLGAAILERVQAVQAYIERECLRKAEADLGFEEATDSTFQPLASSLALRLFRPLASDSIYSSSMDSGQEAGQLSLSADVTMADSSALQGSPRSGRPASFRRRLGRGGRVLLDRKLPFLTPVPSQLADWPSVKSLSEVEQVEAMLQTSMSQQPGGPFNDVAATSSQINPNHHPHLTGPFAFSADVRPTQLTSAAVHVSSMHATGPFAATSLSDAEANERIRHISDASSTSSDWSDRSKPSDASSIGAASTQPTDVEDADVMDIDNSGGDTERSSSSKDKGKARQTNESDAPFDIKEEAETWARLCERWRYDDDAGRWAGLGLTGLGGMENDGEAVIDDFDQRFLKYRMYLLEESDLLKLQTDLSHIMAAQAAVEVPLPPAPPPASTMQSAAAATKNQQSLSQQAMLLQQQQQQQQQMAAQVRAAVTANAMTNVIRQPPATGSGPSLLALQQQQQLHRQQLQLALQQQQRNSAAAATAAAASAASQSSPGTPRATAAGQRGSMSGGQPQLQQQQPHPLSQSFSVNSATGALTPQQIQMQQAALLALQQQQQQQQQSQGQSQSQQHVQQAGQQQANRGATAATLSQATGVQFPNVFPMPVPNGVVGAANGQLQGQMQQGSSSPSPAPGVNGSSPHMNAALAGQQRVNGANAALLLQQQQLAAAAAAAAAAANNQLSNGGNTPHGLPAASAAQILAMKAALAQSPQLQLKLLPNRAMQIAQEGNQNGNNNLQNLQLSSQAALMQSLIAKQQAQQQQQQQQQQQRAQQGVHMQGRASPQFQQGFNSMPNMSGAGSVSPLPAGAHLPSPAMAAAQLQQHLAQGSPVAASSPQMGRNTPGGTPQPHHRQPSQGVGGQAGFNGGYGSG